MFYTFPHILGVYGPIFKIFVVKNIKIRFPVVSKKTFMLPFSRFLATFTYFLISSVILVLFSNFLKMTLLSKFSYYSEPPVCNLLWPLLCQSNKVLCLFSPINIFLDLKNTLFFYLYVFPSTIFVLHYLWMLSSLFFYQINYG